MIVSSVSVPLVGLVGTGVLGHLDDEIYLAAVAAAVQVFSVLFVGCNFLRMGTTGITAQAHGALGRDTGAHRLRQSFNALQDQRVQMAATSACPDVLHEASTAINRVLGLAVEQGAPVAEQAAAACQLDVSRLNASIPRLLDHHVRADLEPFMRSMRRRLDRDRGRVHAYHDELRKNALDKIARLGASTSDKAVADRRRETLRVQAIEREYAAKTDDLRHKYALEIKTEWVQGLVVVAPVQRFEVLIKRRKGERTIAIDWHTTLKMLEPPLDEAGLGLDATRFVCDENLHLTGPDNQTCTACAKHRCPDG